MKKYLEEISSDESKAEDAKQVKVLIQMIDGKIYLATERIVKEIPFRRYSREFGGSGIPPNVDVNSKVQ